MCESTEQPIQPPENEQSNVATDTAKKVGSTNKQKMVRLSEHGGTMQPRVFFSEVRC
jgi:hypothetical protein